MIGGHMSKRIYLFDNLKFLLILLVVVGHVIDFYTFDYKKYQSEDRDFNFDDSYMKGEYCYNFNQLMSTLINPFPPFVSQEDSRKTFWSENVDITPILKATQQLLS